jgi:hypothetical protein
MKLKTKPIWNPSGKNANGRKKRNAVSWQVLYCRAIEIASTESFWINWSFTQAIARIYTGEV